MSVIEVFKTDVTDQRHAELLVNQVHNSFPGYTANFDLSDCDKVLRVKSVIGPVKPQVIIDLLKQFGFHSEVLPDQPPRLRVTHYKDHQFN